MIALLESRVCFNEYAQDHQVQQQCSLTARRGFDFIFYGLWNRWSCIRVIVLWLCLDYHLPHQRHGFYSSGRGEGGWDSLGFDGWRIHHMFLATQLTMPSSNQIWFFFHNWESRWLSIKRFGRNMITWWIPLLTHIIQGKQPEIWCVIIRHGNEGCTL